MKSHKVRRDAAVNWLLIAAGIAHWWNPLYWFVRSRLVLERELACDAAVIQTLGCGRKGKGTTLMLMVDGEGTPLSAFTTAANISEVHAIETLVDEQQGPQRPARLMYDKAADADWLREQLQLRDIELICPHRKNRVQPPTQDGRALRRYNRRYKVERSISWLHHDRRLITRWEWYPELFEGFVHLACLYTILRGF